MSRSRSGLMVATLLAAAACAPKVRSAVFMESTMAPPDQQIRYYSTKVPTCPYAELGLIKVERAMFWNSLQDLLKAAGKRAREMGGDAIVGVREVPQVTGSGENVSTNEALTGTVIRFKDRGCQE